MEHAAEASPDPSQLRANEPSSAPEGAMFGFPVFGVPVYLGLDVLIATAVTAVALLLPFLGLGGTDAERWGVWLAGCATATVVAILIHESAHAIFVVIFRLGLRHIYVGVLGGHTALLRPDPAWWKDFIVSVAGPASNLATAGALWYVWQVAPGEGLRATVIGWMFWVSLLLGGTNLLPILGTDGGRAMQALLVPFSADRGNAAARARMIGAGLVGGPIVLAGVLSMTAASPFGGVVLIALGLWWASSVWNSGKGHEEVGRLSLYTVADAMGPGIVVTPEHPARDLIEAHIRRRYTETPEFTPRPYVVIDELGHVHGVLTQRLISEIAGQAADWSVLTVADVMDPLAKVPVVAPETPMMTALVLVTQSETDAVLVMEEGELVGVLTIAHMDRLLTEKAA